MSLAGRDLLAVDVGLNGLGWARWAGEGRLGPGAHRQGPRTPDSAGVILVPREAQRTQPWTARAEWAMERFMAEAYMGPGMGWPGVQVLEWPEFRAGSAVGHAAAANDSLGMLFFMCGQHFRQGTLVGMETVLLPVGKWKGQLPKEVVQRRLTRAIGTEDGRGRPIETHAWDAIGIGLSWMGFKQTHPAFMNNAAMMAVYGGKKRVVRRRKP